jgi:hypothetical protein
VTAEIIDIAERQQRQRRDAERATAREAASTIAGGDTQPPRLRLVETAGKES